MTARSRLLLTAVAGITGDESGATQLIEAGRVTVDGIPVKNPRSRIRDDSRVQIRREHHLRGEAKLGPALDAFSVVVAGRTALDVGASTGGFTTVLLERGARRVYAVDVGHGQLLGSLRQDPRVVNLEATNVAQLTTELIPEPVEVITVDVSYLALGAAVTELHRITMAPGAELVGLVKPMFELRLATAPVDDDSVALATTVAINAVQLAGWELIATMKSTVTGARGAAEGFLYARWPGSRQARDMLPDR